MQHLNTGHGKLTLKKENFPDTSKRKPQVAF